MWVHDEMNVKTQTDGSMEGQVQIKKGFSDKDRALHTDRALPEEQVRGDDYIR